MSPAISIIIPTLNESENIGKTLAPLVGLPNLEIIVADGQSRDSTCEIARDLGVKVIECDRKGRAHQLNQGAKTSTASLLVFLHADTILAPKSLDHLQSKFEEDPDLIGGAFERFFDSPSRFLKLTSRMANWRTRTWGVFLGDQGIFVKRSVFEELGGFSESIPFGEDLDFSIRLRSHGKTTAIDPPVLSSARRFAKKGPAFQTIIDLWLTIRILFLRK